MVVVPYMMVIYITRVLVSSFVIYFVSLETVLNVEVIIKILIAI